jgi:predicted MFS family arabinose efflux permease
MSPVKFSPAILVVWLAGFLPMESGAIWIPAAGVHFAVDNVTVGLLASAQFAVSAFMAMFIAPRLAQRSLRPRLLVALGIILAAAIATAAFPLSFFEFALARIIEGGCCGLCVAAAAMLASRTSVPARSFGLLQFSQIVMNMVVYVSSTKLVVEHGLPGLYALIAGATAVFFCVLAAAKGWRALAPAARNVDVNLNDAPTPRLRILAACIGAAFVYCGFIALVANATALGSRAGLDFAEVTKVLAAGTPAAAAGALIATAFAKRIPVVLFIAAASIGAAVFGLLLTFTAGNFASLTASFCGVIFFVYIGFPSIFAGIARLDTTGRSAAAAQAAQMFGPALGPAVGAIVAAHSVAGFALMSSAFVALGTFAAGLAILPAKVKDMGPIVLSPAAGKP